MKIKFIMFAAMFAILAALSQTNAIVFPQLLSTNGSVLMTNAEFRAISGVKIFFLNDAGYKSFNVHELNTNVLSTIHVTAGQLEAKQAAMIEANKRYAAQAAIYQAQQAQIAARRQAFLEANNPNRSMYTGLNPDGTGTPSFSNPNNASRTGWDGKHYHDNQSQGNFIGN